MIKPTSGVYNWWEYGGIWRTPDTVFLSMAYSIWREKFMIHVYLK